MKAKLSLIALFLVALAASPSRAQEPGFPVPSFGPDRTPVAFLEHNQLQSAIRIALPTGKVIITIADSGDAGFGVRITTQQGNRLDISRDTEHWIGIGPRFHLLTGKALDDAAADAKRALSFRAEWTRVNHHRRRDSDQDFSMSIEEFRKEVTALHDKIVALAKKYAK